MMHPHLKGFCLLIASLLAPPLSFASQMQEQAEDVPSKPVLTHGIASGDVTPESAVIWARANAAAWLQVEYAEDAGFSQPTSVAPTQTLPAADYTATVTLNDLTPDTRYYYRVWVSDAKDRPRPDQSRLAVGTFQTAPSASTSASSRRAVSFVFGADLGGQGFCRHPEQGYAIFEAMLALKPDFFVANGDMIYADNACPAERPLQPGEEVLLNVPGDFPGVADPNVDWENLDQLRDVFWRHWRYNRADSAFQHFLQAVPMYVQWDDHEVINDFGAGWSYWNPQNTHRRGYQNLVRIGREATFLYAPISRHPDEPNRIYRSFRWGQDLELFLLDARSYRSRNDLPDTPDHHKTLLGTAQLAWLKQGLAESTASWKVVSSDVPLSIPTGSNPDVFGRDGWANGPEPEPQITPQHEPESGAESGFAAQTGFEREMLDLMHALDAADIKNLVFVTTDVHFAATLRYAVDADGDGDMLHFHEFVTGPLRAISLPANIQAELDPTLTPTLLYAEGEVFNFGFFRLQEQADGLVHLLADVRGEDGRIRAGSSVDLPPQR